MKTIALLFLLSIGASFAGRIHVDSFAFQRLLIIPTAPDTVLVSSIVQDNRDAGLYFIWKYRPGDSEMVLEAVDFRMPGKVRCWVVVRYPAITSPNSNVLIVFLPHPEAPVTDRWTIHTMEQPRL